MIVKVKRHNQITFFNEFSVTLRYDAVASSFSFSLYFDPLNEDHRALWQPGHYHEVDIEHNGELLLRGTAVAQTFVSAPKKQLSTVAGYSLPGVLEDCEIPVELYPLQSDGKSLLEIAQRLTSRFPFGVEVDSSVSSRVNSVFDTSTADENQTIKSYLASLASQKNIVLTHSPEGNLLFTEAKTKQQPIYDFTDGMPDTTMSLSYNGQSIHTQITAIKEADIDGGANAGESTIRNPLAPFTFRPKVKIQNSGNDIDTNEAVRNALSEELKNITLTIDTNIWSLEDNTSPIIRPNNIITVFSPELYLFRKTKWFVEAVTLKSNEKKNTASLQCVLPEVYNNQTPEYIFEVHKEDIPHDTSN